jgi:hypothetical protein
VTPVVLGERRTLVTKQHRLVLATHTLDADLLLLVHGKRVVTTVF